MRLFLAVELPDKVRKKICEVIEENKNLDNSLRYVNCDNLHITLKFLGEVSEVDNLINLLNKVKQNKFNCTLESMGTFPNKIFVRVLWIGVGKGNEELKQLYDKINLLTKNIRIEEKPYHTHVTIARCRGLKNNNILDKQFKSEQFAVKEFVLMQSKLSRKGPEYGVVKRFSLI